jgi:hypothetical protein
VVEEYWLERKEEEGRREEDYLQRALEFAKSVGEDEGLQTATAIARSLAEGTQIDQFEQGEWDELDICGQDGKARRRALSQ